jgi:hypothetical protein
MSQTAVPQTFTHARHDPQDVTAQARPLPPLISADWTAVIWERFPKFVFGFLLASALFSFALPDAPVG